MIASLRLLLPSIFTVCLLTVSEVRGQAVQQVDLDKNIGIAQTLFTSSQNIPAFSGILGFTVDPNNEYKGQPNPMMVDLNFNDVLVPLQSQSTSPYGVNCEVSLGCTMDSQSKTCSYNQTDLKCLQGATFMRFDNMTLKTVEVASLQLKMFTMNTGWGYQNAGVLGLSPAGPFWNFVSAAYKMPSEGHVDVSLFYVMRDPTQWNSISSNKMDGSVLTVNGRYTTTTTDQVFADLKSPSGGGVSPVWHYPESDVSFTKQLSVTNTDICIDNSVHAYILLTQNSASTSANYPAVVASILNSLCGSQVQCLENNSKLSNVAPIEVTLYDQADQSKQIKVSIAPKDFIFFDASGVAQLAIMAMEGTNSQCQSTTNYPIGLGRLFLSRAELTLRMQSPTSFRVGFSLARIPSAAIYWIIFGVLAGLILFIILSIIIVRKCCLPSRLPDTDTYDAVYASPTN